MVFKSPIWRQKKFFRRLRNEPFYNNVPSKSSNVPDNRFNIIVNTEKAEPLWMPQILFSHYGSAYNLQLMKLYCSNREFRKDIRLLQDSFLIFAWQSENHMHPNRYSPCCSTLNCITGCCKIMQQPLSYFYCALSSQKATALAAATLRESTP